MFCRSPVGKRRCMAVVPAAPCRKPEPRVGHCASPAVEPIRVPRTLLVACYCKHSPTAHLCCSDTQKPSRVSPSQTKYCNLPRRARKALPPPCEHLVITTLLRESDSVPCRPGCPLPSVDFQRLRRCLQILTLRGLLRDCRSEASHLRSYRRERRLKKA